MKAVQNKDKTWAVVDENGEIKASGLKTRAEARAKAKVLLEGFNPGKLEPAPVAQAPAEALTQEVVEAPVVAPKKAKKTKPVESLEPVELTVRNLYELLHSVATKMGRLTKEFAPKGITVGQADVLNALSAGAPLTQKDLCTAVGCSGGNMTMLVDNLEKACFVERNQDPVDRRRVMVSLTEEGAILAKQASEADAKAEANLFEPILGMSEEKVQTFAEVLSVLAR